MDSNGLIIEANDLSNALIGLEILVGLQFNSISISRDDINGLNGLVAAVKVLAASHAEHVLDYLERSEQ